MRRQLHLHEAGFPCDKLLTSYFIDSQVFFRIFYYFYIWHLTICFWINWVHVYKYTKIKGLDSSTREITSLPESKKVMNMACHFSHRWKWNVQGKFTTPDQLATPSAPLIEVLLIKILLFLDHLFQSNQHFQATEFVDQPIPEKL